MPQYKYKDALGESDEITVIEDKGMYQTDANGNWSPGYEFIDSRTVMAHPFIIDVLLEDAERLWSIDDVLGGPGRLTRRQAISADARRHLR